MKITFSGDDWDNESEAEEMEEVVQAALDEAGIDYMDLRVI